MSERIRAKELDRIEAKAGEFMASVASATDVSDGAMLDSSFAVIGTSLVAEVRRLRSLVLRTVVGLKQWNAADPSRDYEFGACLFCNGENLRPHEPQCPWPEIEAEARAQREDLTKPVE